MATKTLPVEGNNTLPVQPVDGSLMPITPGGKGGTKGGVELKVGEEDDALAKLKELLKTAEYTPKTAEEMQAQAEGQYQSYYDQLRLAAQQQQETSDLALMQQREGLQATFDKQRESSAENYARNYSMAGRESLARGMQRSSYTGQTLSNINTQGAKAQQTIYDQQAAAEGNIDQQRTQLASQLAAQMSQYGASQASDVLNRVRELEGQEYDRSTQANQYYNALMQQMYEYQYQKDRDKVSDEQWKKEFEEMKRQFNAQQAAAQPAKKKSSKPKGSKDDTPPNDKGFLESLISIIGSGFGG